MVDRKSSEAFLGMIKGGFARSLQGIDPQGGEKTVRWVANELADWLSMAIDVLNENVIVEAKDGYDGEGTS